MLRFWEFLKRKPDWHKPREIGLLVGFQFMACAISLLIIYVLKVLLGAHEWHEIPGLMVSSLLGMVIGSVLFWGSSALSARSKRNRENGRPAQERRGDSAPVED